MQIPASNHSMLPILRATPPSLTAAFPVPWVTTFLWGWHTPARPTRAAPAPQTGVSSEPSPGPLRGGGGALADCCGSGEGGTCGCCRTNVPETNPASLHPEKIIPQTYTLALSATAVMSLLVPIRSILAPPTTFPTGKEMPSQQRPIHLCR